MNSSNLLGLPTVNNKLCLYGQVKGKDPECSLPEVEKTPQQKRDTCLGVFFIIPVLGVKLKRG